MQWQLYMMRKMPEFPTEIHYRSVGRKNTTPPQRPLEPHQNTMPSGVSAIHLHRNIVRASIVQVMGMCRLGDPWWNHSKCWCTYGTDSIFMDVPFQSLISDGVDEAGVSWKIWNHEQFYWCCCTIRNFYELLGWFSNTFRPDMSFLKGRTATKSSKEEWAQSINSLVFTQWFQVCLKKMGYNMRHTMVHP